MPENDDCRERSLNCSRSVASEHKAGFCRLNSLSVVAAEKLIAVAFSITEVNPDRLGPLALLLLAVPGTHSSSRRMSSLLAAIFGVSGGGGSENC